MTFSSVLHLIVLITALITLFVVMTLQTKHKHTSWVTLTVLFVINTINISDNIYDSLGFISCTAVYILIGYLSFNNLKGGRK